MRKPLLTFLFFVLLVGTTYAQVRTDTLTLGEFTVESTRIRMPVLDQPVKITRVDSSQIVLQVGADLGSLLNELSSLYIRTNGPGTASIISQNGLGGEQTRVLWEGMALNHQMLGVTDLSLIPASLFSEIELNSGTGSAHFGSGVGGTVYLKNQISSSHAGLSQTVGSFGNRISRGEVALQGEALSFKLSGSTQTNDNSFKYYDESTGSVEHRQRGALQNEQVMGSLKWEQKNLEFKSSIWWNQVDHELPENIYAGVGTASQFDESIRWVNSFKWNTPKGLLEGRMFAGTTSLDYIDEQKGINSLSESRSLSSEVSYSYFSSEHIEVGGRVSADHSEVETNNYTELKSRQSISGSLYGKYIMRSGLKWYPALRFDQYNDFGRALSPSLGLNYSLVENKIAVRALVARNFRAPTFNDLYWPAGGNEELEAEKGWKSEIGLVHEGGEKWTYRQQLTAHFVRLYDGIKWQPDAGGNFKAQNIQEITSRSAEWIGELGTSFGEWKFIGRQSIRYTRSYFSKERFTGDQATGNQLPYVPYWKFNSRAEIRLKGLRGVVDAVYVSDRYTTEQNSMVTSADAYLVFNAALNYSRQINHTQLSISGKLNNLFNERYDVVRFFPMPLRNYFIQISIHQTF